jgi:F-box protein 21
MPTEALLKLSGRYFKRWDRDMHAFVSNVRDEYPED